MVQKKIPALAGKVLTNIIGTTPQINIVVLVPKVCSRRGHNNTIPCGANGGSHSNELLL